MTELPPARAVYLDAQSHTVFGLFHGPAATASRTAVLICPPWGWDEVVSYRARRAWAEHLARSGHPALRIDLPGTGDSGGLPGAPGLVDSWIAAIASASTWLAESSGSDRVAVVGLGLGGLSACAALAAGAPIDDIVLWSAPARGRTYLREQRAFASLQSSREREPAEPGVDSIPDGWLEVSGFVLSAKTIAGIEQLDVADMDVSRLARALVLDRDGMAADAGWDRLAGSGISVEIAPGHGWGAMCLHPERYYAPVGVFERVERWLETAPAGSDRPTLQAPPPARIPARDHVDLEVEGARIREGPMIVEQSFGRSFAILADPLDVPRSSLCAVFLNAGAVRRIGPNRIWVEAARRWAARGVPSLRLDGEAIGDSDGDARMYVDVGRFYDPSHSAHIRRSLDDLVSRGFGPRFVLVGLCAGGYWAFEVVVADGRVIEAIVLNPRALVWDPELDHRREARGLDRLRERRSWRRLLQGDVSASRAVAVGRAVVNQRVREARRRSILRRSRTSPAGSIGTLKAALDRTSGLATRVVLAFSGDEVVHDELDQAGALAVLGRWPNVTVESLPGRDHTVRPIRAQAAVHRLLDRELTSLLPEAPVMERNRAIEP